MKLENEIFLASEPSLESVLYWKGKEDRAEDICNMIKTYKCEIEQDLDLFYENQYFFCKRAISLLHFYKNDSAYEDVFYIYKLLSLSEDEVLVGVCESYLRAFSSEKYQGFLYQQWEKQSLEFGAEELTVTVFSFLLKSGFRSKKVDDIVRQIIWSDNEFAKIMITCDIDSINFADEIKKRLKHIAPMIKYGPQDGWSNPYVSEWVEMAEPYLKHCRDIDLDKYFKIKRVEKSEEDEFILSILGSFDERARKLNEKYISSARSQEYIDQSMMIVKKREELMERDFLSPLPEKLNDWLLSPFVNNAQKLEMEGLLNDLMIDQKVTNEFSKKKIGRNEPCPCHSGKKYKKCCLI